MHLVRNSKGIKKWLKKWAVSIVEICIRKERGKKYFSTFSWLWFLDFLLYLFNLPICSKFRFLFPKFHFQTPPPEIIKQCLSYWFHTYHSFTTSSTFLLPNKGKFPQSYFYCHLNIFYFFLPKIVSYFTYDLSWDWFSFSIC